MITGKFGIQVYWQALCLVTSAKFSCLVPQQSLSKTTKGSSSLISRVAGRSLMEVQQNRINLQIMLILVYCYRALESTSTLAKPERTYDANEITFSSAWPIRSLYQKKLIFAVERKPLREMGT